MKEVNKLDMQLKLHHPHPASPITEGEGQKSEGQVFGLCNAHKYLQVLSKQELHYRHPAFSITNGESRATRGQSIGILNSTVPSYGDRRLLL